MIVNKKNNFYQTLKKEIEPFFIQADQSAKEFTLFPKKRGARLATSIEGLLTPEQIQANLKVIQRLDVDGYIQRTVQPAESTHRPSAREIIIGLNGTLIAQHMKGPFFSAEVDLNFGGYHRRIGFIAQDRRSANGTWMPEHHQLAKAAIEKFAALSIPIVF